MQVEGLVDTTVLVDLLRHYPNAESWYKAQKLLGITNISWMELIVGAENKAAQRQSLQLLYLFEMVYIKEADTAWAMLQLLQYRLSHKVGIGDCLIAAAAYRLQVPLYTHNLKHFTPLLGNLAKRPY
jgi:predicted nucleic acid-binding protein